MPQLPSSIHVDINITKHCNLNCAYCSNLSPLADPYCYPVDIYEQDVARLSVLTSGDKYVNMFCLQGGEPLLHPNIVDILRITRKYFPTAHISLVTNGILLFEQPDEFFEVCKEGKYNIAVSNYQGTEHNRERERQLMESKGIIYPHYHRASGNKLMHFDPYDLEGKQDVQTTFKRCWHKYNCGLHLSEEGILYRCYRPFIVPAFNKYFKTNMEVGKEDWINIYRANTIEEILKWRDKPNPFCRYCKLAHREKKWKVSERKIEEWV